MRELPILFSAPMVRAILEGRKTVTRRVVKSIPWLPGVNPDFSQARAFWNGPEFRIAGSAEMTTGFRCPYGQPGDRLWVREAYFGNHFDHPKEPVDERELHYRADGYEEFEGERIRWRPGIHMPRWASRITLEVTNVRVERLRHITADQAIAEGMVSPLREHHAVVNLRQQFADLWDGLAKEGARWADNPWVWAVSFRRAEVP